MDRFNTAVKRNNFLLSKTRSGDGHGRPSWGKVRPTDRAGRVIGGTRDPKTNEAFMAKFHP